MKQEQGLTKEARLGDISSTLPTAHLKQSSEQKRESSVKKEKPEGSSDALVIPANLPLEAGMEIVPTDEAKALVEYLLGLKRDAPLPAAIAGTPPQVPAAK